MENISNIKFNYLTPIEPLYRYQREWVWKCICDCGKETKVRISKLKNGTTKSCGCHKMKNIMENRYGRFHHGWKGYEDLSLSFYGRIKAGAKLRCIEFNLSMEYLWNLYEIQNKCCAYTGININMPIFIRQLRGENNEDIASLDRIDSSKGYIEGNVQWVCKRVNYMKHTMGDKYFLEWVKSIYEYRIKTQ